MTKPFNVNAHHQKNNNKYQYKSNFNRNRIQKNSNNDRRPNGFHNNNKKPHQQNRPNLNRQNNSTTVVKKHVPHDRAPPQTNNQITQIKFKPFDKSRLQQHWLSAQRVGPGLINGQNTCFLNSVLQCLTYTPPLAQYLLSSGHKKQCKITGYCALCAMETHVNRVFKESKGGIRGAAILPKYFTANLQALSRTLRLRRQEDSHEFLMFLFTAFQKSLLNGLGKVSPKVEESTMLHSIFGGRVQSQVRCQSCKAKSNTFEAFLDLSVDIHRAFSLEKALSNFVKVDMIGGKDPDSKYKCSGCNQKVNAGKQVTIRDLPMMLTVHLKRFTFDLERGYMRKISERIQYPEVIDMAPYISVEEKQKLQGKTKYRLYGVLVHLGHSCNSGHYYSYVKNSDGQWYQMDDEMVEKASLKEVLSQQAYILFYAQETSSPESTKTKKNDELLKRATVKQEEKEENVKEKEEEEEEEEEQDSVLGKRKNNVEEALLDLLAKKKKLSTKNDTASVLVSDGHGSWYVRSSELPFRSLRGNLSPPTFSAASTDLSAWNIRSRSSNDDEEEEEEEKKVNIKTTVGNKYKRRLVPWNITSTTKDTTC